MPEKLKKGWRTWRFDQMAVIVNDRIDNPAEADVEHYVGLEHLDSDSLTIRRWGTPSDVEATKLRFRKGDIIFGRRRVYQRKLGVAQFDGICSAHAMVLRAKSEVVLSEFLPFFMQSDLFMERAKQISVGSLSPTINWKTLAKEEFTLPPLEEQRRIAEVLGAVEMGIFRIRQSQIASRQLWQTLSNREFSTSTKKHESYLGSHYTRQTDQIDSQDTTVTGLPLLTPENISKGTGAILDGFGKAEDAGSNKFVFSAGTILYSRIRPYFQKVTIAPFDGVCSTEIYPLVPCKLVEPKYLLEILLSKDFTRYAVSGMKGTGFPRVSHDYIAKYPISIPSLSHQQTYLSFAIPLRQFDYLAQRRIIEIQAVKTSIIEEVF